MPFVTKRELAKADLIEHYVYLAENASQHADAGYSSERLRLWDADGRQVLDGLQCVAVFG